MIKVYFEYLCDRCGYKEGPKPNGQANKAGDSLIVPANPYFHQIGEEEVCQMCVNAAAIAEGKL